MGSRMLTYFWLPETKFVIAFFVIALLLSLRFLPNERKRIAKTLAIFLLCLGGQICAALLEALDRIREQRTFQGAE